MAAKNNDKPQTITEEQEPIYIPKENSKDDTQYVSVNGRRWTIQKGKTVMVPRMVAEVIRNSTLMSEKAQAYLDGLAK